MEHIVQFAIGIDDAAIQKRVEEHAYDEILKDLMCEVKKNLPRKNNYYNYKKSDIDWRCVINERLDIFITEHKDEIIEATVSKLCDSLRRSKAYKEKMAEAIE